MIDIHLESKTIDTFVSGFAVGVEAACAEVLQAEIDQQSVDCDCSGA